ncbi:MAG: arginine--tRNA ligase [Verrucomicrobiota bacterium]|nr:arginine--tRNA ligase [Verrucomicrobiota bacterium]
MVFKIIADLEKHINSKYGVDITIEPEDCPADFHGDMTVNCFRMAKPLKSNPMKLAEEFAEFAKVHEDVEKVEYIKAFVNLALTPKAVFRDTIEDVDALMQNCILPKNEQKKVLIEFSAPNTNKPQHLGHVRNNTLGMALTKILERAGHNTVAVNLINDRGIHICKSMIAYKLFGEGVTPNEKGIKGDHLVGNYYVKYNTEVKKQINLFRLANPEFKDFPDEEVELQTDIGKQARKMLQGWENGESETLQLWKRMNEWVIDGFNDTYKRFGVEFDKLYLESNTYSLGKDIIAEGLEKGVFYKREDGAVAIDLSDQKLGEKVVLRSDGTSVYITQDIGTTVLKNKEFSPNSQIWVVGNEQIYHFQVLFEILTRLGYSWAKDLHHLAYGMVNLPSGKMKSREGTVVDADDLFDEMSSLAESAILERYPDNPPENLKERAEKIGLGALKFMLLKVNPKTNIMFDPNASIKFEGDTGPYILYAYARISSILQKATEETTADVAWELLIDQTEKDLALACARYPDAVKKAAKTLDCSVLTDYLLNIAKTFNRFYRNCPVLGSEEHLRKPRLSLCATTRMILGDGLKTLTIGVLEEM